MLWNIGAADRRTVLKGIGAASGTLLATGLATAADGAARYVITVNGRRVETRLTDEGFDITHRIANSQVLGVEGPADAEDMLQKMSGVSAVSRDVALELDTPVGPEAEEDSEPDFADLQWDNDVIEVDAAQEIATGAGTRVAVVDTGIDFDHPDLQNVRGDLGRAFVTDDDVPEVGAEDPRGHGTAVAGVVGATGASGVEGVAPETDLIPIRVFPKRGGAFFSDIFRGIDYASEINADAANFSLGIPGALPPQVNRGGIRAAIQTVFETAVRRGTVVTASLGNAGANLQQGGFFTLPTSVPGTFSVSATGPNDELVFYSNYGTNEVDVAAPGGGYETLEKTLAAQFLWELIYGEDDDDEPRVDLDGDGEPDADVGFEYPVFADADDDGEDEFDELVNTDPVDFPYPTNLIFTTDVPGNGGYNNSNYVYIAGTSFSAPQAAGLAALVRDVDPRLNAKQVERAIEAGAELAAGDSDPELGAGRINAKNTVERVDKKGKKGN